MNQRRSQTIRLMVMLVLTFSFFVVELVVGYVTESLALISDSYHMLSDFIALFIGLACVRISYWSSPKNTYGWVRAEVLGALVNSVFLIALCFTILTDGITRLITPEPIHNVDLLLYVGIAGLGINVIGLILFCSDTQGGHHGHSHGGSSGGHGHSHGGSSGGHGHSHGGSAGGHGHSHGGSPDGHGHSHQHNNNGPQTVAAASPPGSPSLGRTQLGEVVTENWNGPARHHTVNVSSTPDNQEPTLVSETAGSHEQRLPTYSTGQSPPPYSVEPEEEDPNTALRAGIIKSGSQLNMIGVFLHVLGDALGSVVVIISALVIKFVPYPWVYRLDPAMSIIMTIIILSTTIPLFKESALVLLQTVPTHIKVSDLRRKLLSHVSEIIGLHEFHIWQLTGNRIVASGHIRVGSLSDYKRIALKVKTFFHDEGIHSTTFQPEFDEFLPELPLLNRDCFLECGPDKQCFENTCCSNQHKPDKNRNNSSNANSAAETNASFENNETDTQQQTTQDNDTTIAIEEVTTTTYV